jgi:hypothetical protein
MGMAKKYTWYVCPSCRSRLTVERNDPGEIRCQNCSTLIRQAVADTASGSTTSKGSKRAQTEDDDEYRMAPVDDEVRPKVPAPPKLREPPIYRSELERIRSQREHGEAAPPTDQPKPNPSPLAFDPAEIRDDQRYAPAPAPRWTFFSGVFTFPWRAQSFLPWLILSLGIALCLLVGFLIIGGITSGTKEGVVAGGFFMLGWVWLLILTGSYASACVFAVTETTAYNYDEPYDWPEPDYRERMMHLLWLGWCLGLAIALVVGPAAAISQELQSRITLVAIGAGFLFPIFLLSTLETNSLSPFSPPLWGSVVKQPAPWIVFYVLSSVIIGACGVLTVVLVRRMGMVAALAAGPLWAAGMLIYARLLGRLAWKIMRPGDDELKAWRKARQSSLAGDMRRNQYDLENSSESGERQA